MNAADQIKSGQVSLGIEFGSTRIKACLIGENPNQVLGVGSFEWENQLVDGLWSYPQRAIWDGLAAAFADLQSNLQSAHGAKLASFKSLGVSAMMHGYLAFDSQGELLVPFRTWRNTNTAEAAAQLSSLFNFNIPLRWSIAHLHQLALEKAEHISRVDHVTTLAGYVHWMLTGKKVLGVGDASGMFPIDSLTGQFDASMLEKYSKLPEASFLPRPLLELLPEVLPAGSNAGTLTESGALLLDPTGGLKSGAVLCPPEGDAGTGMVATNAVAPTTANISAGTSIFAMVVMEKPLSKYHHELDIVTTPVGDQVAMVHCNNGASEMAQWVGMFKAFSEASGQNLSSDEIYAILFEKALHGEPDAGGLVAYNYLAAEPITGVEKGVPTFVRTPDSKFTLANAMKSQIFGIFGTLSLGMRVLEEEGVNITRMAAHGGIFRTAGIAQQVLSAAIAAPVAVSSTASEGGAWGMALLAQFAISSIDTLPEYLNTQVFADDDSSVYQASQVELDGYAMYLKRYEAALPIVKTAAQVLR